MIQYPPAFGEPPAMQTRDMRLLPFGYGVGSGTLAKWLTEKALQVYHVTPAEYDGAFPPPEE